MTGNSEDPLARIKALETELGQAARRLASLDVKSPGDCGTPEHATALARIAELEAALAAAESGSKERLSAFLKRLGNDRAIRRRAELVQLERQIADARTAAIGDRSLLATLKNLRDQRSRLTAELKTLRTASTQ